jgi:hypothetical protein
MTDKLLSAADLAQMRTDLENVTLPDSCAILSVTTAADGEGGMTEAWGTATASIACRLTAQGGGKSDVAVSLEPYSTSILTIPQSGTVTAGDRIVHNGYTYAVTAVDDDSSWLACKRATLEWVE